MKRIASILLMSLFSMGLFAQDKDVVDIAISSKDHTTLVTAVKAAALVETLKGEGPFTIFAPTNEAFDKLPEGIVENLLKEENVEQLQAVLTYHVVAGDLKAADVIKAVKAADGKAMVKTLNGGELAVSLEGEKVKITDANGNEAYVTATDLNGNNGVVHVISAVLLP